MPEQCSPVETDISKEMTTLKNAILADSEYAWSWWCNLVMSYIDEGVERIKAEAGARRFMQQLFDIDMFEHPLYKQQ